MPQVDTFILQTFTYLAVLQLQCQPTQGKNEKKERDNVLVPFIASGTGKSEFGGRNVGRQELAKSARIRLLSARQRLLSALLLGGP